MREGIHHPPGRRLAVQTDEGTENNLLLQLEVPADGGTGEGKYIRKAGGTSTMRIIYKLNEYDIKKILADHFEALPEDIEIRDMNPNLNMTDVEITVNTYKE